MKTTKYSLLSLLFLGLVFFSGCDDDDDGGGPTEEEVITDVTLSLTPISGGDVVSLTFVDRDGDGGDDPVITGGTLQAGTTYDGSIQFFNRSGDEDENVTLEIEEEDDEHQVFYEFDGVAATAAYVDQDGAGNPVGLLTLVVAAAATEGTLTVTLRHEPAKDAAGVSEGLIANAGGETDVEVVFPLTIE
ncbi:type 1 periplasmic binding fold superfamily protein [Lewinellaceae bacterium SD302]|nr:type 1 periplasmic binding fold superfamily protein [Lewinellaceae bacterium SD302]